MCTNVRVPNKNLHKKMKHQYYFSETLNCIPYTIWITFKSHIKKTREEIVGVNNQNNKSKYFIKGRLIFFLTSFHKIFNEQGDRGVSI